ncbi:uncharacterized protein XM38_023220 [Halomicronema hongdechloris C2206]|uniref:DUF4278 domain-containing protein n=1 Tax=Halomicronema hongdechloris C2206 TaxID=1641165 RepID=A0A1Z3HM56_9CYAN|nr:DUF4278 domain-containing protein [Halomicronema hongdechloris]ASC71370.1 uncharacterized protein XM38_023220 [Halomicronema hongdechloris C2206]
MKLTYRGVSYDYNPPAVDVKDTNEIGKYRGVDIRFRSVKKAAVQQPTLDLVYRGAAYRVGQSAEPAAPAPAQVPVSTAVQATPVPFLSKAEDRARLAMLNHHRAVKRRQQSMLGRLAHEIGLTADVSQYWNHIQGKVHPSFWATYDRSRSAAS